MILTVIIALEFKKSLLVIAERGDTVIQIRSVVMIALLAICRKVIILDLTETNALHILAFAAAIFALGMIYWLIGNRDQNADEPARGQRRPRSSFADENRQLRQRRGTCPRQYDIARGVVQLKAIECNGDELAIQSGKVADGKDDVVIAILAENEIIDSPDCFSLFVDHLL